MLEQILLKYFNLLPFWDDTNWEENYSKLVSLIYDLEKLGVIDNANEIIDKLDKIDNEN